MFASPPRFFLRVQHGGELTWHGTIYKEEKSVDVCDFGGVSRRSRMSGLKGGVTWLLLGRERMGRDIRRGFRVVLVRGVVFA